MIWTECFGDARKQEAAFFWAGSGFSQIRILKAWEHKTAEKEIKTAAAPRKIL